jgi:hypothetical protein
MAVLAVRISGLIDARTTIQQPLDIGIWRGERRSETADPSGEEPFS